MWNQNRLSVTEQLYRVSEVAIAPSSYRPGLATLRGSTRIIKTEAPAHEAETQILEEGAPLGRSWDVWRDLMGLVPQMMEKLQRAFRSGS